MPLHVVPLTTEYWDRVVAWLANIKAASIFDWNLLITSCTQLHPLVQVCEQAGVPLHVVPLTTEYWDRVVASALADIKAGRTPNPDMLCNSRCAALHHAAASACTSCCCCICTS